MIATQPSLTLAKVVSMTTDLEQEAIKIVTPARAAVQASEVTQNIATALVASVTRTGIHNIPSQIQKTATHTTVAPKAQPQASPKLS